MTNARGDQLARISRKLRSASSIRVSLQAFGADRHEFELGAPLTETVVADFEARHEVVLPQAYRLFVTQIGDGGAGPGYRLRALGQVCGPSCRPGHLRQPSPYLPGPRYPGDWEQRYEDPPGPDRTFLRGTLPIADHGCTLSTRLIVTGPARGRLFNLDIDGMGPYLVEDTDFLAWYERWLDETLAGHHNGWFGESLPLNEPAQLAALANDPSPARRTRAGETMLQLPTVTDTAWNALTKAVTTDPDPTVRAELLVQLTRHRPSQPRHLEHAETLADDIAEYARSRTPAGIGALATLGKLTLDDLLPELADHDAERRRTAAYHLAFSFPARDTVPREPLEDVIHQLLADRDPLLRSHSVTAVCWFNLVHLQPALHELQSSETDGWVQHTLHWCLARLKRSTEANHPDPWST